MFNGLRPTSRLVAALSLGLALSLLALQWRAAAFVVVGLDALLLLAWLIDAWFLLKMGEVRVQRRLDARLALGVNAEVELSIEAQVGGRCTVIDEPPALLVPAQTLEIPRRTRLVPTGRTSVQYSVCPRRRGHHVFGPANLIVEGPLRLAARRISRLPEGDRETRVYPDLGDIDQGALDPELMMAELGIKRVRKRAEGTEFESLREAVLEDELRRIDWRATARRGKLIARNYELERNHEVLLCLDTGRLMGGLHEDQQTKLDHAIGSAIRLAAVALRNGDRVGVMSFDHEIRAFSKPDRGRAQLGRLIAHLHDLEPTNVDASYALALGEIRSRQRKRALIVFFTDFVDVETSARMLEVLSVLKKKHALLFVALRNPRLDQLGEPGEPQLPNLEASYRALATLGLSRARSEVIENLSARGVRALDLSPRQVTAGAIQAYLALRSAGRL